MTKKKIIHRFNGVEGKPEIVCKVHNTEWAVFQCDSTWVAAVGQIKNINQFKTIITYNTRTWWPNAVVTAFVDYMMSKRGVPVKTPTQKELNYSTKKIENLYADWDKFSEKLTKDVGETRRKVFELGVHTTNKIGGLEHRTTSLDNRTESLSKLTGKINQDLKDLGPVLAELTKQLSSGAGDINQNSQVGNTEVLKGKEEGYKAGYKEGQEVGLAEQREAARTQDYRDPNNTEMYTSRHGKTVPISKTLLALVTADKKGQYAQGKTNGHIAGLREGKKICDEKREAAEKDKKSADGPNPNVTYVTQNDESFLINKNLLKTIIDEHQQKQNKISYNEGYQIGWEEGGGKSGWEACEKAIINGTHVVDPIAHFNTIPDKTGKKVKVSTRVYAAIEHVVDVERLNGRKAGYDEGWKACEKTVDELATEEIPFSGRLFKVTKEVFEAYNSCNRAGRDYEAGLAKEKIGRAYDEGVRAGSDARGGTAYRYDDQHIIRCITEEQQKHISELVIHIQEKNSKILNEILLEKDDKHNVILKYAPGHSITDLTAEQYQQIGDMRIFMRNQAKRAYEDGRTREASRYQDHTRTFAYNAQHEIKELTSQQQRQIGSLIAFLREGHCQIVRNLRESDNKERSHSFKYATLRGACELTGLTEKHVRIIKFLLTRKLREGFNRGKNYERIENLTEQPSIVERAYKNEASLEEISAYSAGFERGYEARTHEQEE